jgi:phage gpG-like protein
MAFNFKEKAAEIRRVKSTLPIQVGNIAKNHFLDAFRDQGFTDTTLSPWAARKTKNRSDRNNSATRAILVESGDLRRSIRVGMARFERIEVGSYGVSYARYHNKGEGRQPIRKFVGASVKMSMEISKKIRKEVNNILK